MSKVLTEALTDSGEGWLLECIQLCNKGDFAAFNTTRRTGIRSLERQRSPVFIVARRVPVPPVKPSP